MKAVVYDRYGPPEVLRLEEVDKPEPGPDEVLIKVQAVSLNGSDWEGLCGKPGYARIGGLRRPRRHTLGSDIAGLVEQVGDAVTEFKPGDEVFGDNLALLGGFAQYAVAKEKALALKPPGLSFVVASTVPQAGVIALQGIRDKGQVRPGHKVLVNGAGGGAGMFAIQLAKLYGAEVTAVDNTYKQEFLRELGADHVVDYTREDFSRQGKTYDLILDIQAHRSVFAYRRSLKPDGKYYCVGGSLRTLLRVLLLGPLLGKIRVLAVRPNRRDLLEVAELCEHGKITPFVEREYPLSAVPDALRHLGEGRALGKLVINQNL